MQLSFLAIKRRQIVFFLSKLTAIEILIGIFEEFHSYGATKSQFKSKVGMITDDYQTIYDFESLIEESFGSLTKVKVDSSSYFKGDGSLFVDD